MAQETIVIDITSRYQDETSKGFSKTTKASDNLAASIKKTQSLLTKLGKTKAITDIEAKDLATKSIQKLQDRLKSLKEQSKLQIVMNATDKVSSGLNTIFRKAKQLTGNPIKFTATVVDKATKPLQSIYKFATSIRGVLTGMIAGQFASKFIKVPAQMAIQRQNITTAFSNLLGSNQAAEKRIQDLTDFASQTPYTRDDLYQASRILQVYTKNGKDMAGTHGMKLVGDIAQGTQQDFNEVANWIGRLYTGLKSGQPVGEATSRLMEMGAISGDAAKRIQALTKNVQKGKTTFDSAWASTEKEFSQYNGMMEKMSGGFQNLLLGAKTFVTNNIFQRIGAGIIKGFTPALQRFRQWRSENSDDIAKMAQKIEDTTTKVVTFVSGKVKWLFDSYNKFRKDHASQIKEAGDFAKKTVGSVIDFVSRAFGTIKKAYDSLTSSYRFKAADFFEKTEMLGEEVIAKPIKDWWNGGGKAEIEDALKKVADKVWEFIKTEGKKLPGVLKEILDVVYSNGATGTLATIYGLKLGTNIASGINNGVQKAKGAIQVIKDVKNIIDGMKGGGNETTGTIRPQSASSKGPSNASSKSGSDPLGGYQSGKISQVKGDYEALKDIVQKVADKFKKLKGAGKEGADGASKAGGAAKDAAEAAKGAEIAADGATDAATAAGGAAGTAATETGGFATTLGGLASAGVIAGLAIGGIAVALAEHRRETKEDAKAIGDYKDKTKKLLEESDAIDIVYGRNTSSIKKKKEATLKNCSAASKLNDRLKDLMKAQDGTTKGSQEYRINAEKIKTTVSDLNALLPGLNLAYDEETGKISENTKAIKENIKKRKDRAKLKEQKGLADSYTKEIAARETNISDKRDQISSNNKKRSSLKKKMSAEKKKNAGSPTGYGQKYFDYKRQYESLGTDNNKLKSQNKRDQKKNERDAKKAARATALSEGKSKKEAEQIGDSEKLKQQIKDVTGVSVDSAKTLEIAQSGLMETYPMHRKQLGELADQLNNGVGPTLAWTNTMKGASKATKDQRKEAFDLQQMMKGSAIESISTSQALQIAQSGVMNQYPVHKERLAELVAEIKKGKDPVEAYKNVMSDTGSAASKAGQKIKNAGSNAQKTGQLVKGAGQDVSNGNKSVNTSKFEKLKDIFNSIKGAVKGALEKVKDFFGFTDGKKIKINDSSGALGGGGGSRGKPKTKKKTKKTKKKAKGHANGGMISQPTIALVGEAGPEVIVPITKKDRGLEMLSLAASEMGVTLDKLPQYAEGGQVGGSIAASTASDTAALSSASDMVSQVDTDYDKLSNGASNAMNQLTESVAAAQEQNHDQLVGDTQVMYDETIGMYKIMPTDAQTAMSLMASNIQAVQAQNHTQLVTDTNKMKDEAISAYNQLPAPVNSAMSAVNANIRSGMNQAVSFMGTMPGIFRASGHQTMNGLKQGIDDTMEGPASSISNAADLLLSRFRKKLGIHSPSTEMRKLGRYTMEGLIKGLNDKDLKLFTNNTIADIKDAWKKGTLDIDALVKWLGPQNAAKYLAKWGISLDSGGGSGVEGALSIFTNLLDDDTHGYSQAHRWGPDFDCSSSIIYSLKKAGMNIGNPNTTHDMSANLTKHGWDRMKVPKGAPKGLQRGDIMLNDSKHVEWYLGNGILGGFHSDRGHPQTGDQTGTEANKSGYRGGWKAVLRYQGGGSDDPNVKVSGSVKDWLTQALQATGKPMSDLAPLARMVKAESGGNPKAINNRDSNAKAGHPSKGLLQTIDSTFKAYALPGHGNIWNPVDNAIASIRYQYARYGHIVGHGGYAQGGLIDRPTQALMGEAGPEVVVPLTKGNRSIEMLKLAADKLGLSVIEGGLSKQNNNYVPVNGSEVSNVPSVSSDSSVNVSLGGITVNVSGGGNAQDVAANLQEIMPDLANELCQQIAEQLSATFQGVPMNIGA